MKETTATSSRVTGNDIAPAVRQYHAASDVAGKMRNLSIVLWGLPIWLVLEKLDKAVWTDVQHKIMPCWLSMTLDKVVQRGMNAYSFPVISI